jgi:hypothetical protein
LVPGRSLQVPLGGADPSEPPGHLDVEGSGFLAEGRCPVLVQVLLQEVPGVGGLRFLQGRRAILGAAPFELVEAGPGRRQEPPSRGHGPARDPPQWAAPTTAAELTRPRARSTLTPCPGEPASNRADVMAGLLHPPRGTGPQGSSRLRRESGPSAARKHRPVGRS